MVFPEARDLSDLLVGQFLQVECNDCPVCIIEFFDTVPEFYQALMFHITGFFASDTLDRNAIHLQKSASLFCLCGLQAQADVQCNPEHPCTQG